jgi:ABC-type nitrate/sulfonate/bicarbonate transport system substrate-binding protein
MIGRHPRPGNNSRPLRLGFVPLCDCAPLVMAQELGLFEKHGLKVHLSREPGWATVRDKIIYRELDAAHALAPMVFAASLGLGSVQTACVSGLVLSLNGNAITLAQSLHDACARKGETLKDYVRQRREPLILGIPFLYSSHHFLLRAWLRSQGLTLDHEVQLVVVPPPQMPSNLKAGHLDGYCVGAPWNSVAKLGGFGWRAASSRDISPQHPEKVLMVRREFAELRAEEHERLIAALVEACLFCDAPRNRERIIETLGEPQYINAPAAALREGCEFTLGHGDAAGHAPSAEKATWVLSNLSESGLLPGPALLRKDAVSKIFRPDIFQKATLQNQQYEATKAIPHLAG